MNFDEMKHLAPWEWPENAGAIILEILRDSRADPFDRLTAAGMGGDIIAINDELAETLLAIVRSGKEPEELRSNAAIALGPVLEYVDTMGFDMEVFEIEEEDPPPISENAFRKIKETLRKLYMDADIPKEVRRRILEAAVRAPQNWHQEAVRAAYASTDGDWQLTAVFCMQFLPGFDDQIAEALENKDPQIYRHAIAAAGQWGIEAAWPHITAIIGSKKPDKNLLLAAIDAAVGIRPQDAVPLLTDLADADDQDIVDAVMEAISMAGELSEMDDEDDYGIFDDYADDYDDEDL